MPGISEKLFLASASLEATTAIFCPSSASPFSSLHARKKDKFKKKKKKRRLWSFSYLFFLYVFPHLGCAAFLGSVKQKSRAVEEERQSQGWVWWVLRWEKGHKVRLELMGGRSREQDCVSRGNMWSVGFAQEGSCSKGSWSNLAPDEEIWSSRVELMEPVETWLTKQIKFALQAVIALLVISSKYFLLGDFILSWTVSVHSEIKRWRKLS